MKITPREKLIQEALLIMGAGVIDVELTKDHMELALNMAFERYRLRSMNATEERFAFLQLQPGQTAYTLPDEVTAVKVVYRRGTAGTVSAGGTQLDPFALSYTNQYLLQSGQSGGLLTYELFTGYQELVGKMFGLHIVHIYDPTSHTLRIERNIVYPEDVLLWIECHRPDEVLLADGKARIWLRDYTVARAKFMLGDIRGKFQQIAGPNGGTSLNGDALKAEAKEEMDRLENEVKMGVDGYTGYGFIIG